MCPALSLPPLCVRAAQVLVNLIYGTEAKGFSDINECVGGIYELCDIGEIGHKLKIGRIWWVLEFRKIEVKLGRKICGILRFKNHL